MMTDAPGDAVHFAHAHNDQEQRLAAHIRQTFVRYNREPEIHLRAKLLAEAMRISRPAFSIREAVEVLACLDFIENEGS